MYSLSHLSHYSLYLLGKKMIDRTVPKPGEKKPLNLLVCNVYQDNTNHTKLCQLIESKDPDIVFLLETDNLWKNGLKKSYR